MRILIQRVKQASVDIDGNTVAAIDRGLLLLVGFCNSDSDLNFRSTIDKIINLRIFPGTREDSDFDKSVSDSKGGILVVSQFTLYADCRKGRRPGFSEALNPGDARLLYDKFVSLLNQNYKNGPVTQGVFGANMQVNLQNDGPTTIMLET